MAVSEPWQGSCLCFPSQVYFWNLLIMLATLEARVHGFLMGTPFAARTPSMQPLNRTKSSSNLRMSPCMRSSFHKAQPVGHSKIIPPFPRLCTSLAKIRKLVNNLPNRSKCLDMISENLGLFRALSFCQGEPPVHGNAPQRKTGISGNSDKMSVACLSPSGLDMSTFS